MFLSSFLEEADKVSTPCITPLSSSVELGLVAVELLHHSLPV